MGENTEIGLALLILANVTNIIQMVMSMIMRRDIRRSMRPPSLQSYDLPIPGEPSLEPPPLRRRRETPRERPRWSWRGKT